MTRAKRILLMGGLALLAGVIGHARSSAWDGRTVNPLTAAEGRAVVLIFMDPACATANRLVPEIERIARDYGSKGVAFWAVYADHGTAAVRRQREESGLMMPVVLDTDKQLRRRAGIDVTPSAVVYLRTRNGAVGQRNYRGRINELQGEPGGVSPAAKRDDLREVLAAIVAGSPLPRRETTAEGCFIDETMREASGGRFGRD